MHKVTWQGAHRRRRTRSACPVTSRGGSCARPLRELGIMAKCVQSTDSEVRYNVPAHASPSKLSIPPGGGSVASSYTRFSDPKRVCPYQHLDSFSRSRKNNSYLILIWTFFHSSPALVAVVTPSFVMADFVTVYPERGPRSTPPPPKKKLLRMFCAYYTAILVFIY